MVTNNLPFGGVDAGIQFRLGNGECPASLAEMTRIPWAAGLTGRCTQLVPAERPTFTALQDHYFLSPAPTAAVIPKRPVAKTPRPKPVRIPISNAHLDALFTKLRMYLGELRLLGQLAVGDERNNLLMSAVEIMIVLFLLLWDRECPMFIAWMNKTYWRN
jgi:hypothetical protein